MLTELKDVNLNELFGPMESLPDGLSGAEKGKVQDDIQEMMNTKLEKGIILSEFAKLAEENEALKNTIDKMSKKNEQKWKLKNEIFLKF